MSQPRSNREIEIRHCSTLAEYDECVRLEKVVWGGDIVVPSPIFVVAHHTGGQVLGAFKGTKLIGFTLALAAVRAGKPYLHSHMTAVLPKFRDSRTGRRLKLFQREDALKRGIDLVEWTFDPLDLKNAHFNLNILGAAARRLIPDCYGVTESPLHGGLPTDRLVAEWWLGSGRVKSILAGKRRPASKRAQRIALPENMEAIKAGDRAAAARIQRETREQFQQWFAKGFVATGVETRDAETAYLLEPAASIEGLRLPKFAED
ncbi:MAG: GNAT family N-acetyltransferase [Acidobacteriia bacterium]|nr:GNAT family N-acetyltransferase [Terriglobia bacterium]